MSPFYTHSRVAETPFIINIISQKNKKHKTKTVSSLTFAILIFDIDISLSIYHLSIKTKNAVYSFSYLSNKTAYFIYFLRELHNCVIKSLSNSESR